MVDPEVARVLFLGPPQQRRVEGAHVARGGGADLSDFELARAIAWMANQSGASLKEPAPPKK